MTVYVKLYFISIFSIFLVLNHYFIIIIDFTRITALNTATNDVANLGHTEYLIQKCNLIFLCSFCNRNWWKI